MFNQLDRHQHLTFPIVSISIYTPPKSNNLIPFKPIVSYHLTFKNKPSNSVRLHWYGFSSYSLSPTSHHDPRRISLSLPSPLQPNPKTRPRYNERSQLIIQTPFQMLHLWKGFLFLPSFRRTQIESPPADASRPNWTNQHSSAW